jgi:hypothetical protein
MGRQSLPGLAPVTTPVLGIAVSISTSVDSTTDECASFARSDAGMPGWAGTEMRGLLAAAAARYAALPDGLWVGRTPLLTSQEDPRAVGPKLGAGERLGLLRRRAGPVGRPALRREHGHDAAG